LAGQSSPDPDLYSKNPLPEVVKAPIVAKDELLDDVRAVVDGQRHFQDESVAFRSRKLEKNLSLKI